MVVNIVHLFGLALIFYEAFASLRVLYDYEAFVSLKVFAETRSYNTEYVNYGSYIEIIREQNERKRMEPE